jgi:hypothetical protein
VLWRVREKDGFGRDDGCIRGRQKKTISEMAGAFRQVLRDSLATRRSFRP